MRFRERQHEPDEQQGPEDSAGDPSGGNLDRVRQEGQRLLAAADQAISRALSGDSQKFLAASRQKGGQ